MIPSFLSGYRQYRLKECPHYVEALEISRFFTYRGGPVVAKREPRIERAAARPGGWQRLCVLLDLSAPAAPAFGPGIEEQSDFPTRHAHGRCRPPARRPDRPGHSAAGRRRRLFRRHP